MSKITSLSFFRKKTRAVRIWFKEEITIFSIFEADDTPIHYKLGGGVLTHNFTIHSKIGPKFLVLKITISSGFKGGVGEKSTFEKKTSSVVHRL